MPQAFPRYSSIALVKEIESLENPEGLEKRVALVPSDVGQLVNAGIKVYVEIGAGEGVGFSDDEYLKNNKAVILGYGNVGQGALAELHQQGIKKIHVLGRSQTAKSHIDYWLKDVDIVINGAEQSAELRGKNFLLSNQHLKNLIPEQSVVIDLVGGSPTNRSPVEAVMSCSFLTEPYFVQDGVLVSSLWDWPMMGMMRETAIRYSGQIVDVLIGAEKLIDGLGQLTSGVKRAMVCGPFKLV